MGVIGHNRGPSVEGGGGWKTHCWRTARENLLPTLPIEVVRLRVKRARELGLPYKTYAGVRAQTGEDVIAFLFSSNALRVSALSPALPPDRVVKLSSLMSVDRMALTIPPLRVAQLDWGTCLEAVHPAPPALASWPDMARHMRAVLGKMPADRVVLVAEAGFEAEWAVAGRLAACLPAQSYFA